MPEGWRWWGGWYLAHSFSSACRQAVMWGRFYLVVKGCYPYSDWHNCSVGFAIKLTLDRAQFFQLWFCEGGSCRFFFLPNPHQSLDKCAVMERVQKIGWGLSECQDFHWPFYDWIASLATKMQMEGLDMNSKLYSLHNYDFETNLSWFHCCRHEQIPTKAKVQVPKKEDLIWVIWIFVISYFHPCSV